MQSKLQSFLLQSVSFHDASSEAFYHGLVLGLCAVMDDRYHVTSNREAGEGRFDIQMMPMNKQFSGKRASIAVEN